MRYQLSISGVHFEQLQQHLFPGDGKEAVAVALCGRYNSGELTKLMVHQLELIPHDECERGGDFIHWKTQRIIPLLEKAGKYGMGILKIHSHPNGYYDRFSEVDDESDALLFPSVFGWTEDNEPHLSAIMLPDGKIISRAFFADHSFQMVDKVVIAGDVISIWEPSIDPILIDDFGKRTAQAFGEGTYKILRNLTIGVVGCSGTGSIVVEQLARYGIKKLILVDNDTVEFKNLNRIINATSSDAQNNRLKADVLAQAIDEIGLGTSIDPCPYNLYDSNETLLKLAGCDVVFGCMDSVDGRHILNQLATFFLLPYIDVGVRLVSDGQGNISSIIGSVNYLQPGKSSLLSRGLYDLEDLKSAGAYRKNPLEFSELVKYAYFKDVAVNRPAVISVNMGYASLAVNELLNRLHPYRGDHPKHYAQVMMNLSEMYLQNFPETDFKVDHFLSKEMGKGSSTSVFLNLPELSATDQ
ncbi:hypothetical protein FHS57_006366 [Runella defluvii]|uniref:THIF-type NAD/FAD binding fold domain-containing protein n=1 Tax=Runella defluvii TaxID=370973 RepID=A0A7W5ZTA8_9BACT|nr:ThiF family adenylyltransferase [Runella defluvii]MBB3842335.1 hypothetical protein [Runella defluvii]